MCRATAVAIACINMGSDMADETLAHLRKQSDDTFIPHATIQIFAETEAFEAAAEAALSDRRMSRVKGSLRKGSLEAARLAYENAPSPDLLIIESTTGGDQTLQSLDRLAEVCASATNVVIIGYVNDVSFYRRLIEGGVKDYAIGPLEPLDLLKLIANAFGASTARIGRTVAVTGTCGGIGASTIAQNLASMLASRPGAHAILADFDLHFGSSTLAFNLDARQGVLEAASNSSRLDAVLLDRLLADHRGDLRVLASPASLDSDAVLDAASANQIIEVAAAAAPYVVIDLPRLWCDAARHTLKVADDVVIVASPTLRSLRNAKHLAEAVRAARPHDSAPRITLNQVGIRRRIEIPPAKFGAMLDLPIRNICPFDINVTNLATTDGGLFVERWPGSGFSRAIAMLADDIFSRPVRKQRTFMHALDWLKRWRLK